MAENLVYILRGFPAAIPRLTSELRYSLRSVDANVAGLGEVHSVGGRPEWAREIIWHRVRQSQTKHVNTWGNWLHLAELARRGDVPDEFVIMNDDFFAMRPVPDPIAATAQGSVDEWIAARKFGGASVPADVMTRTRDMLEGLGVPREKQRSFELHMPFPVRATAFADAMAALKPLVHPKQAAWDGWRIAKRTAVANLAGLAGEAIEVAADVKVREVTEAMPDSAWWSTSDESFRRAPFKKSMGDRIRSAFPEPCRFEAPK